jgi:RNA polymerase subunit RPABC4/transcription elongation factor Spt4
MPMKKKECPSCAMDVDARADQCPICGYEFTDKRNPNLKWVAIILAILFLLMALRFL